MFHPSALIDTARRNISRYDWARAIRDEAVAQAAPWAGRSEEELWLMMFGPTITRAWHVWSNGFCPSCRASVTMYLWKTDPFTMPWKVACPHCQEQFPKNDFEKYHRSGLNAAGIFDAKLADRTLLFNTEHPDPTDPLHFFGVDDGEGYVTPGSDGAERWRFIGYYLIYGQWKRLVVEGIRRLTTAYVLTGDPLYARKAGILLDRVADLYPSFDHKTQSWVYETVRTDGFVSTWHDACEETRDMILGYDAVRDALKRDVDAARFLQEKSLRHGLRSKATPADVCANIEEGLIRTALREKHRIHSNYPRQEIAVMVALAVLDAEANRAEFDAMLDEVIKTATAVDGVTGEKGLSGYTCFTIQSLAIFLMQIEYSQPGRLRELFIRHPRLARTWRFHIDTWILQRYYPQSGDSGYFGGQVTQYCGVFARSSNMAVSGSPIDPSMFAFLHRLYEITGDFAYLQLIFLLNGGNSLHVGRHLFEADPNGLEKQVAHVIAQHGPNLKVDSINLQEWHLAILRSGAGEHARAAWIDYDSGGHHSHADGMNIGLCAFGLDLMPDFGYPPVQYGGWNSPQSTWYRKTASHNTVVIDNQDQSFFARTMPAGRTTLWGLTDSVRVIRVSGADIAFKLYAGQPEVPGPKQYERTLATIDLSPQDFYIVDIFRVVGGRDHAKFQHSFTGSVTSQGLTLKPADVFSADTLMRNFQTDPRPATPWRVDWKIHDEYGYLPSGAAQPHIGLRYTDLTHGASASLCEGWVSIGFFDSPNKEAWIPRVMVRRTADTAPLASCFVSVVEPYNGESNLRAIRRLPLHDEHGRELGDMDVAIEVELADGRKDLIVALDAERVLSQSTPGKVIQRDWNVTINHEFTHFRRDSTGRVTSIEFNG